MPWGPVSVRTMAVPWGPVSVRGMAVPDFVPTDAGSEQIYRGLLYWILLMGGEMVLELPWAAYSTFVIEERFGFNKTSVRERACRFADAWVAVPSAVRTFLVHVSQVRTFCSDRLKTIATRLQLALLRPEYSVGPRHKENLVAFLLYEDMSAPIRFALHRVLVNAKRPELKQLLRWSFASPVDDFCQNPFTRVARCVAELPAVNVVLDLFLGGMACTAAAMAYGPNTSLTQC